MSEEVVKNTKKLSKSDITFYRLVLLFVYAIVSLIGINVIAKNEIACRPVLDSWIFKVFALLVFALCVFAIVKKIGEDKTIRLNAIAKVAAPVFFMFALYTNLNMGYLKTEIVIIATVLLSFVDIVYPKSFYFVSLFYTIEFAAIYYVRYNSSSKIVDQILAYISYPISIIIPVCFIVLAVLLLKGTQIKKLKSLYVQKKNQKMFNYVLLVTGIFALVCAILVMVLPVVYVVMPYVLLGGYILMGVVGTVKII